LRRAGKQKMGLGTPLSHCHRRGELARPRIARFSTWRRSAFGFKRALMIGRFLLGSCCVLGASACNHDAAPAAASSPSASVASAAVLASAPVVPAPSPMDSTALLAVGADVPDVSAPAQDGKVVHLRELKGKPLIVYFYPKDDTPGCTIEAKGIRDQYAKLKSRAVVLGVSADSLDSHRAFAAKYELPFLLLDDSSHALTSAFGVPLVSGHAKRVTFVVDAAGKVRNVFPNVNPEGHAQQLLEALKALG
jgi:peroxiredoxin Q/BCP